MPASRFTFTAFGEADLTDGHIIHGVTFTQPDVPTLSFSVTDNDGTLSGDFFDRARDFSGQTAEITRDGDEIGNGGKIYAERVFEVEGSDGKTYTLVEIEQEHSHVDYFAYLGDVPPAGVALTVGDISNVGRKGVAYEDLGAGDLPPNIVEIAAGSDDFNILVKALSAAGLVETVQNANDITVFAPTDAAFTQLAVDLGFEGDTTDEDAVFDAIVGALTELGGGDPIPLLTDVLLYHVSPGEKSAAEIDAAETVDTLLAGATFGTEGTALIDNEPDIANPEIVIPDIPASNGTIQAIDRVLIPLDIPGNEPEPELPNIVEIATGSDDFNLLVKALSAAGLVETVQDASDITVFAPTDAAFTQLAVDLGFEGDTSDEDAVFDAIVAALTELGGGDPIPLLTDVLLYHVSPGAKSAEEIDAAETIETLLADATFTTEGSELIDNEPDIENPDIVIPDIPASNGTVQAIDRVLLPLDIPGNEPEPELPTLTEIVAASGGVFDENREDFDLLLNALQAAGLAEALNDPEADLTVFAPNDAAFVGLAQALGFEGEDEGGAFAYIVEALTLLSGGEDPIPLLTDILLYHVAPTSFDSTEVLASETLPTLLGTELGVDGTSLVDQDPDVADPQLIATDIPASNGIAHVIDGVLLPVDVLPSDGSNGVDFEIGDDANETFRTGRDNDFVSGLGGRDDIGLGRGDDVGLGGDGNDILRGNAGNDILNGGDGNDTVRGGRDNDRIDGGAGRDVIVGGRGDDMLAGGADADLFIFNRESGTDTISDFEIGADLIRLRGVGSDDFDDIQEIITDTDAGAVIEIGEVKITLEGVRAADLTESDFVFA